MIFACMMTYGTDRDLLLKTRPDHRAYLKALIEKGQVVCAGSFVPEDDGGLFLYRADTLDEATALVRNDPYVVAGVSARYELRGYEIHGANADRLEVYRAP